MLQFLVDMTEGGCVGRNAVATAVNTPRCGAVRSTFVLLCRQVWRQKSLVGILNISRIKTDDSPMLRRDSRVWGHNALAERDDAVWGHQRTSTSRRSSVDPLRTSRRGERAAGSGATGRHV